ncbi:MAG TPA: AlkA N-terminal domain-containing protein [Acidimicrobiales bacterium]|nr:AlkA N-terminal domain-containing protein [Acidimicrobiales bacterium]
MTVTAVVHSGRVIEDFDHCYRAVMSRDARFDGWFFTAVTSTGIYCRPSCPARTPRPENVRFLPSAAAAQVAGFRACRRCRPDASPGSPEWNWRSDAVARAMRILGDGVVDREGVAGLARRLGYSVRQLERLFLAELGAGPATVAGARRAETARLLVETTDLPMTQVAFAAGFSSVRQFNDRIRAVFALTPTELRRRAAKRQAALPAVATPAPGLSLRLPLRLPFEPDSLFGHLAATAIPGCEEVRDGWYRRTLRLAHGPGIVALRPEGDHVSAVMDLSDLRDLSAAVGRCRRLLDLDADPVAVDAALGRDRRLAPLVASHPGRRLPGSVDGAEMALRAVLGQQVSTAGARTVTGRLVALTGEPVSDPRGGLTRLFPAPEALVDAPPVGLTGARAATVSRLAEALAGGRVDLDPGTDWAEARSSLAAVAGVGPWTVELVAMRALGDPDAFPATDLGVRRAADHLGLDGRVAPLTLRAERWRPWRAYAVQYLWGILDHPVNRGLADADERRSA